MTFVARHRRESGVFVATVDGIDGAVTWGRTWAQTTARIHEAMVLWTDDPDIEITHVFVGRAAHQEAVAAARGARERAERAASEAADATLEAINALYAAGLSVRDIGGILGLSHQRVAQLIERSEDDVRGKGTEPVSS